MSDSKERIQITLFNACIFNIPANWMPVEFGLLQKPERLPGRMFVLAARFANGLAFALYARFHGDRGNASSESLWLNSGEIHAVEGWSQPEWPVWKGPKGYVFNTTYSGGGRGKRLD